MIIDRPFSVVSVTRNLFNQFGQAPCAALIATVMPTEGDTPAIFLKARLKAASGTTCMRNTQSWLISLQAHHHPPADASAFQALFFLGRRWPSGIPSNRAFCLRAPGVRLSALETVLTGVLFLECCLSSFTSARVQSRRTTGFRVAAVLAINLSPFFHRL
jgi:hypothetical protein